MTSFSLNKFHHNLNSTFITNKPNGEELGIILDTTKDNIDRVNNMIEA